MSRIQVRLGDAGGDAPRLVYDAITSATTTMK
jgi:hypothetical protein